MCICSEVSICSSVHVHSVQVVVAVVCNDDLVCMVHRHTQTHTDTHTHTQTPHAHTHTHNNNNIYIFIIHNYIAVHTFEYILLFLVAIMI